MTQLHKFLQAVKSTFSSMTALQRNEVATYLVPEVVINSVSETKICFNVFTFRLK